MEARSRVRGAGFSCGGYSLPARGRSNQDRFRLSERGFVVCDGIGGSDAGEVFAEMVAWKTSEQLNNGMTAETAIAEASTLIERFRCAACISGGASGSVVSMDKGGGCSICSCGDTRAFLVNGEGMIDLSSPNEDSRGFLTSYIGSLEYPRRCSTRTIGPDGLRGSALLLVSDGVWKYLSGEELADTCRRFRSSSYDLARSLVEQAKSCLSPDDCTAVACLFDG